MSNTNYSSKYNEIFEINGPELDNQILAIDNLDIYLSSESSSKTDHGDTNDKLFQDDALVNSVKGASR